MPAKRLSRRAFMLRLGGASALITVVGTGLGRLLADRGSRSFAAPETLYPPPVDPAVPPESPPSLPLRAEAFDLLSGMRPELTTLRDHYVVDINMLPPSIDGQTWHLDVAGLVRQPLSLTLADFFGESFGRPLQRFITLACISNPVGGDLIGTTLWTGVPVRRILERAGLLDAARWLRITGADRYHETLDLSLALSDDRIMLAYMWENRPLSVGHGYPLRLYIPDRYGMKQPKWITRLEVLPEYEEGYWVQRGWDREARVRALSVIDSVSLDSSIQRAGQRVIPLGGMAFAGARGISQVEVRVDNGPWQTALLRSPLSTLTWVQWRYDWSFQPGSHTFTVRCVDGDGHHQLEHSAPPHPAGASGLHSLLVG